MPDAARPVLLAVDDDPHVLRAIRRDLTRAYQRDYRVVATGSAAEALRVIDRLRERDQEPALLLVDQRMPDMTGIEFFAESLDRCPDARRVLLTGYADTEVAIDAINRVRLHHYLVKPWEPPTERLYPVLDELLDDWRADYQPPYGGITVTGHRFAPATHRLRDFLTRLHQPFRFVEVDAPEHAPVRPVVRLPDGTELADPTQTDLLSALNLTWDAGRPHYDIVIVGAGPSGLAAAVYGSSEGLSTVLLEAYVPGGQAGTSSRIENYLGFPAGITGAELTRRAVDQARRFGTEVLSPVSAVGLRRAGRARVLTLSDGREISAGTVLLSSGLSYQRLDAVDAERFEGAGIYYGATASETSSCADSHVWIVGGANSAGQAALHFARTAAKVTMLLRAHDLAKSMSRYLIDEIEATPNIEVRPRTVITATAGDERLTGITLSDVDTGAAEEHPAEFVFTFIGAQPRTAWLDGVVRRDDRGFVLTGPDLDDPLPDWDLPRLPLPLETSMPGVFAAGDVRSGSVKRIASGVGEGAMAVSLVHRYRAES
ncbi:FAD-dependent oxidoreductase [Actinokineospora auranticolor]|uniref:Thioredoxin reductase (NADPH) n=1 Tax=Actinokineospora auranticolor TaxID=155976 RepID=A0A2S6GJQ0_9PSEU|nr:FAD-dependent oxidoreductase [Actinokineospora auranticolor]PPK65435.1 thioredoxin reductase (NADPH) [Actinokineospora auranticolor]